MTQTVHLFSTEHTYFVHPLCVFGGATRQASVNSFLSSVSVGRYMHLWCERAMNNMAHAVVRFRLCHSLQPIWSGIAPLETKTAEHVCIRLALCGNATFICPGMYCYLIELACSVRVLSLIDSAFLSLVEYVMMSCVRNSPSRTVLNCLTLVICRASENGHLGQSF